MAIHGFAQCTRTNADTIVILRKQNAQHVTYQTMYIKISNRVQCFRLITNLQTEFERQLN